MSRYSFIWDLDGTLFKSYDVITYGYYKALLERGYTFEKEEIMYYVQKYSKSFFVKKLKEAGIPDTKGINRRASQIEDEMVLEVTPAPYSMEILEWLDSKGIDNYVFTHRGSTTYDIMDNIGMGKYFKEIVTSENHFKSKPHPDALIYLVDKYGLDRDYTFFVGDRTIDIECGINAGLKTILFLPDYSYGVKTGKEDHVIKSFLEIKEIVKE